ncbi:MAG: GIY-YIG nuclease family protein [Candidatus Uhrbacteria bacterium]
MYYVYVLKSERDDGIYVGYTGDLRDRILRYQRGEVISTKARRPLTLVYYEAYVSKFDARSREISLKKHGQQREQLKKRIAQSLCIMAPSSSG